MLLLQCNINAATQRFASAIAVQQPVDIAEATPIKERIIATLSADILGWADTCTRDADRVDLSALALELGLDPDLVLPQIAEIVLVEDGLANAQLEIGEFNLATAMSRWRSPLSTSCPSGDRAA